MEPLDIFKLFVEKSFNNYDKIIARKIYKKIILEYAKSNWATEFQIELEKDDVCICSLRRQIIIFQVLLLLSKHKIEFAVLNWGDGVITVTSTSN